MTMSVPFNPPGRTADRSAIHRLVRETAATNRFLLSTSVAALEDALCERTGWAHAIACASHAGAAMLALRALGAQRGGRVAVPAVASRALAVALNRLGVDPVPVGTEWPAGAPDRAAAERAAMGGVAVFLLAHPFAVPADFSTCIEPLRSRGAAIVEDASSVQGAVLTGELPGPRGDALIIDLSPGRPVGSVGEAAAILTNDPDVDRVCRRLRNHGQDGVHRFLHYEVAYNSRMDEIVAGSAIEGLARLDAQRHRGQIAERYTERLSGAVDLHLPDLSGLTVPDAYVLLGQGLDALRTHLRANHIDARPHDLVDFSSCSAGADFGAGHLALPLHADMSQDQVNYVAGQVLNHYA